MNRIMSAVIAISLIAAIAVPASIYAQPDEAPMQATITKLEGTVMVTKSGSSAATQAKLWSKLGSGDRIQTSADGKAQIEFDNGNSINLTPKSDVVLSRLSSYPDTAEYVNLIEARSGKMRVNITAKVTGRSTFKIKTPTAICGARGTVFYLVVSGTETRVFVTDGSVDVSNPNTGDTFMVVENMAAISSATGVSEPVEITGADRDAILAVYNESLSAGTDIGDAGAPPIPDAPSQTDDPQSITENPPSQS